MQTDGGNTNRGKMECEGRGEEMRERKERNLGRKTAEELKRRRE